MKEAKVIRSLWSLLKLYPWGIPVIVTLGILSSLSEGLGISLFIPLLQSLDQPNSVAAQGSFLLNNFNQLFARFPPNNRLIIIALSIFCTIVLKNCISYSNTTLLAWSSIALRYF